MVESGSSLIKSNVADSIPHSDTANDIFLTTDYRLRIHGDGDGVGPEADVGGAFPEADADADLDGYLKLLMNCH